MTDAEHPFERLHVQNIALRNIVLMLIAQLADYTKKGPEWSEELKTRLALFDRLTRELGPKTTEAEALADAVERETRSILGRLKKR